MRTISRFAPIALIVMASLILVQAAEITSSGRQADIESKADTPALRLASPFQDNMVLQQMMAVPVWGWSTPGAEVTVEFAGQKVTAKAGRDGKWALKLKPMKARAEPAEMLVSSSISNLKSQISNILVGEVWFCSGQSNMAWKMGQLGDRYDKEMKEADYPRLRLFSVPKDMFATTPQTRVEGPGISALLKR